MTAGAGTFEIIDLSEAFYREKNLPTPPARDGKFVLMRNESDGSEYLVLSPAAQSFYHADVVEKFCRLERFRIPGRHLKKGERFVIDDRNWTVAGGGMWDIDERQRRLRLHGSSVAYGACLLADLVPLVRSVPAMAGWRVVAC